MAHSYPKVKLFIRPLYRRDRKKVFVLSLMVYYLPFLYKSCKSRLNDQRKWRKSKGKVAFLRINVYLCANKLLSTYTYNWYGNTYQFLRERFYIPRVRWSWPDKFGLERETLNLPTTCPWTVWIVRFAPSLNYLILCPTWHVWH